MQQEADRVRAFSRRAIVLGGAQLGPVRRAGRPALRPPGATGRRVRAPRRRQPHQPAPADPAARPHPRPQGPAARRKHADLPGPRRPRAGGRHPRHPGPARQASSRSTRSGSTRWPSRRACCAPSSPISVREDLTWEEVSLIAVNAPDLPGRAARFRPAARLPARADPRPRAGLCRAPSTRPSRRRTATRLMQLPDFRIGKNGIERSYDKPLRGTLRPVARRGQRDRPRDPRARPPRGRARRRTSSLSLDLDLQRSATSASRPSSPPAPSSSTSAPAASSPSPRSRASTPARSPTASPTPLWNELSTSPRTPLVNKCIRGQYPPGSTFKTMTAMAGLETGAITPSSPRSPAPASPPWARPASTAGRSTAMAAWPSPRRSASPATASSTRSPAGSDRCAGRDRQPLRPRRQARHRHPGRAARPDPHQRLEEEEVQGRLAEGRDADLRHRPGLRQHHPAPARRDDRAAGSGRA